MWRPAFESKTRCGTGDGGPARNLVQDAMPFRTRERPIRLKQIMPDVARKARSSKVQLPVSDDRTSNSCSDKNTQGMFASNGGTQFQFSVHCGMHIVTNIHAGERFQSFFEGETFE